MIRDIHLVHVGRLTYLNNLKCERNYLDIIRTIIPCNSLSVDPADCWVIPMNELPFTCWNIRMNNLYLFKDQLNFEISQVFSEIFKRSSNWSVLNLISVLLILIFFLFINLTNI